MAHIVISSGGRYRISDGDTVEIVANPSTSNQLIRIQQDGSDPAPFANTEITFSGDLAGRTTVIIDDSLSANVTVNDGVKLPDTLLRFDAPNTAVTNHTITLGDNTEIRQIALSPTRDSEITINSGENVIWGEPGEDDYVIRNSTRAVDDTVVNINIGANNTIYGPFTDGPRATTHVTFQDNTTIDAEGTDVELSGPGALAEESTVVANGLTVVDANTLFTTGGGAGSNGTLQTDVTITGLTHNVVGADASGLVDVANGRLIGTAAADTLHLGGDLSSNDAVYQIAASSTESDTSITDTLDFLYVDDAQRQEFINAYVAAGGVYDPVTGVFGAPPGVDPDTITWSISQRDGTGTLEFSGWEAVTINPLSVVCFCAGTLITTDRGEVAIEDLRAGDRVLTMDSGYQELKWIGSRKLTRNTLRAEPKLNPIRIKAGALGNQRPSRDLLVSRQHRMLIRSELAREMFDTAEVLIPAIKLCALEGVEIDDSVEGVEYFHMLFDDHQIVFADDAPSESLFTGPFALKSLSPEAREEIFTLFPELADPDHQPRSARVMPDGKSQNMLVARLSKVDRASTRSPDLEHCC